MGSNREKSYIAIAFLGAPILFFSDDLKSFATQRQKSIISIWAKNLKPRDSYHLKEYFRNLGDFKNIVIALPTLW